MDILLTLATRVQIDGTKLDAFKVLTADYFTTLFFSTQSLLDKYDLVVIPIGSIRGTDVCDLSELFDAAEEATDNAKAQELYRQLEAGLDNEATTIEVSGQTVPAVIIEGQVFVEWDVLSEYVNMSVLSRRVLLQLLKRMCFCLDETVHLHEASSRKLIELYGKRKPKSKAKATRGFANATN